MRRCSHIVPQQVGKGNPVGKKEMLAYAVLCIKKLKSWGAIAGSGAHNFRDRETPNADAERTPDNATFAGNAAQDSVEAIKATITIGEQTQNGLGTAAGKGVKSANALFRFRKG